jgi:hypothetical protein
MACWLRKISIALGKSPRPRDFAAKFAVVGTSIFVWDPSIVFQVFDGLPGIMPGQGGIYFHLPVFVTCHQRPVGIWHAPPTRAGYLAIDQSPVRSVFHQQLVYLSTDNAAMLFHDI